MSQTTKRRRFDKDEDKENIPQMMTNMIKPMPVIAELIQRMHTVGLSPNLKQVEKYE